MEHKWLFCSEVSLQLGKLTLVLIPSVQALWAVWPGQDLPAPSFPHASGFWTSFCAPLGGYFNSSSWSPKLLSHSMIPSARRSSWTCCMYNSDYQVIKLRREWKAHMVVYILTVFIIDKYLPTHTQQHIQRKGLFALSLKSFQRYSSLIFYLSTAHKLHNILQKSLSLSVKCLIMF